MKIRKKLKPKFHAVAMNASGIAWDNTTTKTIIESDTAAIVMKTVTSKPKNTGTAFFRTLGESTTANRIGLKNLGLHEQYLLVTNAIRVTNRSKKIVASIYGGDPRIETLMTSTFSYPFAMVEINMSCPNLDGDNIIGYDFGLMESQLRKIQKVNCNHHALAVKLPYYATKRLAKNAWKIISQFPSVVFIVCINTIPGLVMDTRIGQTIEAGIGGQSVKSMALLNVSWFAKLARNSGIDIIGCGGISTYQDAVDFQLVGAKYVQVGSAAWLKGPKIFEDLNKPQSKL